MIEVIEVVKNAQLFYFTGTGNTLALAKAAAAGLEAYGVKVEVTNVLSDTTGELPELVGIFFPVYSYGAPRAVNRFLKRIQPGEGRKAFVVANAAESAGPAAIDVGLTLKPKGYKVLHADWVRMPSNYILGRQAIADDKAAEIVAAGEAKVKQLVATMLNPDLAEAHLETQNKPFHRFTYWAYLKTLKYAPRFYKSTDKCTGCGACVEMCPTGSITLSTKERPVWGRGCEHCLRCVNLCPQAAIEFTGLTKGKRRYTYWQGRVD